MKKLYITLCTLLAVSAGITLQAAEPVKIVDSNPSGAKPSVEKTSAQRNAEMNDRAKQQSANKQAADARNQKEFGTPDNPSTPSSTVDLNSKKPTDADVNTTAGDHSTASTPSQEFSLNEKSAVDTQPTESKMTPEAAAEFQDEFGISYTEAMTKYPNLETAFQTFENKYEDTFKKNTDPEAKRELVAEYMKDLKLDTLPEKLKNFVEKNLYDIANDDGDGFTGQIINLPAEQGAEPTPSTSSASSSHDTLFSEAESKNETEQAQDKSGRTESTASDRVLSMETIDLETDVVNEAKKVTDKSGLSKFLNDLSKRLFGKNSENPEVQDAINKAQADGEAKPWWSPTFDNIKFTEWFTSLKQSFKSLKKSFFSTSSKNQNTSKPTLSDEWSIGLDEFDEDGEYTLFRDGTVKKVEKK